MNYHSIKGGVNIMNVQDLVKQSFHGYVDCMKESIIKLIKEKPYNLDKWYLVLVENKDLPSIDQKLISIDSIDTLYEDTTKRINMILSYKDTAIDLEIFLGLETDEERESYCNSLIIDAIHRNIDNLTIYESDYLVTDEDDGLPLVAPPSLQPPPCLDDGTPIPTKKKSYRQVQRELFGVCRPDNLEKRYSASRIRKILKEKYNLGYIANTHYKYGRSNNAYQIVHEARQHYRITNLENDEVLIKRIYNHEIGKVLEEQGDY